MQPAGVIPEGAHRQGQGAAVCRDIDQGVGVRFAAPGEVEEGELSGAIAVQGRGQGDPDLQGAFVQRGEGAHPSLVARVPAHPAKQGVERPQSAHSAADKQGQADRGQGADTRQQAESVQPAHQIDDWGQPVDHPEALVTYYGEQAHHHQGQQQIETPLPQGIAEAVPEGIVASTSTSTSTSTAARRPGQPVGGDGPLGGFHQQPVCRQGAGGPEGAAAMQVQHAIQPAAPGFESGKAQSQQQREGHGTQTKQAGQDQQLVAPGPDAVWPGGQASQPNQGQPKWQCPAEGYGFHDCLLVIYLLLHTPVVARVCHRRHLCVAECDKGGGVTGRTNSLSQGECAVWFLPARWRDGGSIRARGGCPSLRQEVDVLVFRQNEPFISRGVCCLVLTSEMACWR